MCRDLTGTIATKFSEVNISVHYTTNDIFHPQPSLSLSLLLKVSQRVRSRFNWIKGIIAGIIASTVMQ